MVKKLKRFNYQKDLKKKWKKLKEKKKPKVNAEKIQEYWDPNKSIRENYKNIGLCLNPNETIYIPKAKNLLHPEVMEIEKAKFLNSSQNAETPAIKKILKEANQPNEKIYNLNENDALYCMYMIEKYGNDYNKMSLDHQNHYQETANQIKKKISLFKKNSVQYDKYLNDKANGVDYIKMFDL